MIALIIIVVIVVIIIVAGAAIAFGGKKSNNGGSNNASSSQTSQTPGVTPTPTTPPTSGNVPAGFKQITSPLYSIAYPEDWSVDASSQEIGTTSFTSSSGQIFQVDVENSGDEVISQYLTLFCQTLGDQAGSPTNVTIGGQQWQQLVCTSNGQPTATAEGVTYNNHIFTINYFSLGGTFATDDTQYYKPMEQSFAFLS